MADTERVEESLEQVRDFGPHHKGTGTSIKHFSRYGGLGVGESICILKRSVLRFKYDNIPLLEKLLHSSSC